MAMFPFRHFETGEPTQGQINRAGRIMMDSTISAADSPSIDAFGRWRTSNTAQRFDVEFIYDKQPLIVDEVTTGGGTATHVSNTRDITLAVNDANSGTGAGLYSHYDIPYTPGNSQLADVTGVLDYANLGTGTAELFIRTSISGTPVDYVIPQSDWETNKTGINWNYSHILAMDFQSLKVGRIRYYLVQRGIPVLLKEIHNDNLRNSGYWQTPSLPLYWRIYNDATYTYMEMGYGDTSNAIGIRYRVAVNASATMKAICGTVKSEGGEPILDMAGFPFAISNRLTPKTVEDTFVPVLSLRVAPTFNSLTNRGVAVPLGFSLSVDNPVNYRILYRPVLTDASWQAVDVNSFMQYDLSATAVTGGVLVDDDDVSTARNLPVGEASLLGRTILSQGRTGTSDILTIAAVRTTASNASTTASLKWKEIR